MIVLRCTLTPDDSFINPQPCVTLKDFLTRAVLGVHHKHSQERSWSFLLSYAQRPATMFHLSNMDQKRLTGSFLTAWPTEWVSAKIECIMEHLYIFVLPQSCFYFFVYLCVHTILLISASCSQVKLMALTFQRLKHVQKWHATLLCRQLSWLSRYLVKWMVWQRDCSVMAICTCTRAPAWPCIADMIDQDSKTNFYQLPHTAMHVFKEYQLSCQNANNYF